ncbi:hypothetical protein G5B00_05605 [Parapedobacter sp. SGR-10]|uniref:hypothetical protein n=1 Tax=Parapedobacter sp. SGR-10 TaxID=2710879 RepID=UPI0013D4E81E|nr:hypothetical protein [Parapedobacter sp. SGR-10]NGF55986.1 hypothetical protein [Parapedobacter sp. SGR-10]
MENKDIDKLFRQTFEDAEQEVHPAVWQNIEKELDKNSKKTIPVLFKAYNWVSYAAAILIILGIGFFLFKSKPTENIIAEQPASKQKDSPVQMTKPTIERSVTAENTSANATVPTAIEDLPKVDRTASKEKVSKSPHDSQGNTVLPSGHKWKASIVALSDLPTDTGTTLANVVDLVQTNVPTTQVTEVEPIKPLIVFEEEEESMYAANEGSSSNESTVITTILNKLSENIDLKSKKEVRFKSDDEGSIRINLINPLAKNRNKKRK